MNSLEKETIAKIKLDFETLKNKGKLSVSDEEKLLYDITGLLGIYSLEKDKNIKSLIKEMIAFSESQNWNTQAPKLLLKDIEK